MCLSRSLSYQKNYLSPFAYSAALLSLMLNTDTKGTSGGGREEMLALEPGDRLAWNLFLRSKRLSLHFVSSRIKQTEDKFPSFVIVLWGSLSTNKLRSWQHVPGEESWMLSVLNRMGENPCVFNYQTSCFQCFIWPALSLGSRRTH